jgi:predicted O-methyltransferase YrrM
MGIKNSMNDKLQMLLNERPAFHEGETEIGRSFNNNESLLSVKAIADIKNGRHRCYGLKREVLSFIAENTNENSKTLETGAGCSTLVFGLSGAAHIAVTPSLSEINLIGSYAIAHEIPMNKVRFVQESSDSFLPKNKEEGFDLVLLDGKHAFPWPVIDWFYTADKLKLGGLMIIDDIEMRSVSMLVDFLKADTGWAEVNEFSGQAIVFKKKKESVHDVAWHMQPYAVPGTFQKIGNRLKQILKK